MDNSNNVNVLDAQDLYEEFCEELYDINDMSDIWYRTTEEEIQAIQEDPEKLKALAEARYHLEMGGAKIREALA